MAVHVLSASGTRATSGVVEGVQWAVASESAQAPCRARPFERELGISSHRFATRRTQALAAHVAAWTDRPWLGALAFIIITIWIPRDFKRTVALHFGQAQFGVP